MTKICPKCNTKNADSSGFCQNCGEELPKAASKPSKTGGIGEWWNKRGSGAKVGIIIAGLCCIGLIAIVALAGMASPDKTTSTTTTAQPTTNTQSTANAESYIEVSYSEGSWDGSITIESGNDEQEINFDGSGTKKFDLAPYAGKDVYVNAQKNDDSSGKLSAVVVKNGQTKMSKSTTEGYGIVSGWVFSYE